MLIKSNISGAAVCSLCFCITLCFSVQRLSKFLWKVFTHFDFIYSYLHIYCTVQLTSPHPYNWVDLTWIFFSNFDTTNHMFEHTHLQCHCCPKAALTVAATWTLTFIQHFTLVTPPCGSLLGYFKQQCWHHRPEEALWVTLPSTTAVSFSVLTDTAVPPSQQPTPQSDAPITSSTIMIYEA